MSESGGGQEYDYSVGASGSVPYTATWTENVLDAATTIVESGNLSVSMDASGRMYPNPLTIDDYSTSANGSYAATVTQTYGLLAVYSQRTGSGTGTFDANQSGDVYDTGDYSYDQSDDLTYSWSGAGDNDSGSDREEAAGIAPDTTGEDIYGTFTETGTTDNSLSIQYDGNAFTGNYKGGNENYGYRGSQLNRQYFSRIRQPRPLHG
jgi:hypothetical protein